MLSPFSGTWCILWVIPAWLWAGGPCQETESLHLPQITSLNTPTFIKWPPLLPGVIQVASFWPLWGPHPGLLSFSAKTSSLFTFPGTNLDFMACCSTWPNALNSLTHHSFGHNLITKPLEVWKNPASSEPWLRRAAQLRAQQGRLLSHQLTLTEVKGPPLCPPRSLLLIPPLPMASSHPLWSSPSLESHSYPLLSAHGPSTLETVRTTGGTPLTFTSQARPGSLALQWQSSVPLVFCPVAPPTLSIHPSWFLRQIILMNTLWIYCTFSLIT